MLAIASLLHETNQGKPKTDHLSRRHAHLSFEFTRFDLCTVSESSLLPSILRTLQSTHACLGATQVPVTSGLFAYLEM